MPRPKVVRERTTERGVQKVTRKYDDGREVVTYRVLVRGKDGVLHSEGTFSTFKKASAVALSKRNEVKDGKFQPRSAGSLTVRELADLYLDAEGKRGPRRKRTRDDYERILDLHILPRFGNRKINTMTESDVVAWKRELVTGAGRSKPLNPATLQKVMGLLRWMFDYAAQKGYVARNPTAGVSLPTAASEGVEPVQQVTLTLPEVDALASAAAGHHPSYGLLIHFMAGTGLRMGEVAGLNVEDLELTPFQNAVQVRCTYDPRHGRGATKSMRSKRAVPLPTHLVEELRAYLAVHPAGSTPTAPLWLARQRGSVAEGAVRPLDPTKRLDGTQWPRRVFAPAAEAAGLVPGEGQRLTPHALRHTFASYAIAAGIDPLVVSRWLGHASVAITERIYMHIIDSHQRAAAAQFDAWQSEQRGSGRSQRATG